MSVNPTKSQDPSVFSMGSPIFELGVSLLFLFVGVAAVLTLVRQMLKSKEAEKICLRAVGTAFIILVLWGLLDLVLEIAPIQSWWNIFVICGSWIAGNVILIGIAKRIIQLVEVHRTIFKLSIWFQSFLWLGSLVGVFFVTAKLILQILVAPDQSGFNGG